MPDEILNTEIERLQAENAALRQSERDRRERHQVERGRLLWRLRRHDVEEFRDVVTRHGFYKADLALFAKACFAHQKCPDLWDYLNGKSSANGAAAASAKESAKKGGE